MQFGAPVNKYNTVLGVAKMGTRNYHEMYLHALKVNAEEGLKRGIVYKSAPIKEINKVTQEFAETVKSINTDYKAYSIMKHDIYQDVIHSLQNAPGINDYAVKKIFAYKGQLAKL